MLVASSTLLFGVGVAMLAHADSLAAFYWVEAIMGLAYGIYMSVDMALILEVLPNPDDSGKDLGVFNMANAIPQSAAPFMGPAPRGRRRRGFRRTQLHPHAVDSGTIALVGAVVVLPIRKEVT